MFQIYTNRNYLFLRKEVTNMSTENEVETLDPDRQSEHDSVTVSLQPTTSTRDDVITDAFETIYSTYRMEEPASQEERS